MGTYEAYLEEQSDNQSNIEALQLESLELPVRFSLHYCDTNKKYCIKNVARNRNLLRSLYKRLGHFEKMNWRLAIGAAREDGISIEKKETDNHKALTNTFPQFTTFGHIRIPAEGKSIFRVFGAIKNDLFYILRFDVDGKENH